MVSIISYCESRALSENSARYDVTLCDYVQKLLKHRKLCLFSVIEHGMTPFRFQTTQKNSASLRSSIRQSENSITSYRAL